MEVHSFGGTVSGEGAAFDATVSLATCLPGSLGRLSIHVAICLRLSHLAEMEKEVTVGQVLEHKSMQMVMNALTDTTSQKQPLPGKTAELLNGCVAGRVCCSCP